MRELWQHAVNNDVTTHIAEDDAVLHPTFAEQAHELLSLLPDQWDIMLWGYTHKCGLTLEAYRNGPPLRLWTANAEAKLYTDTFLAATFVSNPVRCYAAWNTFAYSVTPAGARKLLDTCWPIKAENGRIPGQQKLFPIYGLDAKMACLMNDLSTWIAWPPLAFHPHDPDDSNMNEVLPAVAHPVPLHE